MRIIITLVALNVSLIAAAQVATIGTTASGSASTAIGVNTTASGDYSTAIGTGTIASGEFSTAMGYDTTASGDYSTTFGLISKAQGNTSAAMGYGTIASDYGSLVIGVNNLIGSTITSDADYLDLDNTAFVIGNGAGADNRSDALTVLFDGTTNVAGSVTATAFIGDGSGLTSLPLVLQSVTENGNTGIRLSSANTNIYGDIGGNALDLTFSNSDASSGATGASSVALGENTTASGTFSTALGVGTQATGQGATALGSGTVVSGWYATASGFVTTASGTASTAMGQETTASGDYSTALGYGSTASENYSTAMGLNTEASGPGSTAMGLNTAASGLVSTAMGYQTIASDYGSLVIGQYNSSGSSVTNSASQFSTANTAFVIGNGTFGNASDAFKVMFNGDAYVYGSLYLGATAITSTAAELNLLAGKTAIGVLGSVTEGSNTGVRLSTSTAANHGDIGSNAVDLSYNNIASTEYGATGDYSTAIGYSTAAMGDYSTAMGWNTTAWNYSTAMGHSSFASGDYSTAMGSFTTASGFYSTAMGRTTTASGFYSTATGRNTTASGNNSTATGRSTTASGARSTAMNSVTTASDYGSLVIGQYNSSGSSVTNSATQFSLENTAFVIGNGTDGDNRSDALTVLFDGTTNVAGSVTATSFIGDGSQLTNLSSSSPFSLNTTSGNGIQSNDNTASGDISTATGYQTTASGIASTAMGNRTLASGGSSTAMGYQSTASGTVSTAMGEGSVASGAYSTAMGRGNEASGWTSTAMGTGSTASGDYSTSMGDSTTASGVISTAMGYGTIASDYGSLVIGVNNLIGSTITSDANNLDLDNTAFVIGNGADAGNRSDALTVLFDGTTTIAGDLSINSDARLKANIISLGSTLAKLLQIDGKTYTMKKDENKKQKIGVLAQDIEKVFPELVSESNGVKSVNYQGLVPVLINALKEQQAEIDRLKTQEERLDRLERLVAAMDLK